MNPVRKAIPCFWGIRSATKKQAMAIDHQGRKRQAAKLSIAIRSKEDIHFIFGV
jgi:hypothetical protein